MKFSVQYFRYLGFIEAVSLLVLMFIAVPAKRIFGEPALVQHIGGLHGVLFLMYVYTLLTLTAENHWKLKDFVIAFILSCLPFGTFYFDRKILPKLPNLHP